jgi:hypothetical protein
VLRLPRRARKQAEPIPNYDCPRCGASLSFSKPEDKLNVSEHRVLHLAVQWGSGLRQTTGWIKDADGGLRPVVDDRDILGK